MAEKIIEVPASPKAATAKVADVVVETSPEVKRMETLLSDYAKCLSGRIVSVESGIKAALILSQATTFLIANPTREVFNVMWNFHKTNADGVCQESVALTGIRRATTINPTVRAQTIFLYNAFRSFVKNYTPAVSEKEFLAQISVPALYRFLSRAK